MSDHPQLAPRWYVVYTHARSERKVHTELIKQGVKSFLPLRKIKRNTSEGMRNLTVPLFSNYVFVYTTLQKIKTLSKVSGLAKFVSFAGKPIPVPEHEIVAIRQACYQSLQGVGDKVVIVRHKSAEQKTVSLPRSPLFKADNSDTQVA